MSESNFIYCKKTGSLYDIYNNKKDSFISNYLLYKFKNDSPTFLNGWEDRGMVDNYAGSITTLYYDEEMLDFDYLLDGRHLLKEIEQKEKEFAFLWLDHISKQDIK